jgi:NAD(P)H-dependent flavin oxidoreductase YrpB (nitropropane dioxygenase family)
VIRTPFHDLFQTALPIIQAGMGPYDTTKLAGAVAGRIDSVPKVQDLCDVIMREAEAAIRNLQSLLV